jgi:ATP-dependent Clp protease protease subunit
MGNNIRFVNRGAKTGEIWLYDQVGEGFFGGMSAKQFNDELNKLGKVDTINLRINSPGGSVFDGVAIYNTLKRHPARLEVDVDGIAASIASVIAMAGDEIRMAGNAMMMIHDPYGVSMGSADEMRKTADLLDQIKTVIVSTYAKRTGELDGVIAQMMADETWMTAAEAQQLGFSDTTTEEQRIAAAYDFDFSKFKHPPKSLTGGATPARDMAAVRLQAQGKRIAVLTA